MQQYTLQCSSTHYNAAVHITMQQYTLQRSSTHYNAAVHITMQQYTLQRSNTHYNAETVLLLYTAPADQRHISRGWNETRSGRLFHAVALGVKCLSLLSSVNVIVFVSDLFTFLMCLYMSAGSDSAVQ